MLFPNGNGAQRSIAMSLYVDFVDEEVTKEPGWFRFVSLMLRVINQRDERQSACKGISRYGGALGASRAAER